MEILNIIFLLSTFIFLYTIGSTYHQLCYIIPLKNKDITPIQYLVFNCICHINIILFLSILNLTIDKIILVYLALIVFFSISFIKNFKKLYNFNKNKYYLLIILFICFIICIDISNSLTLGWDSQKFWFYKSINFFTGGTIETLKDLEKGDGYDYPYLGSLLWAFFWKLSFINEEYFGRLFYVFIYVLSIFSLVDCLNSTFSKKLLVSTILILLSYDYLNFQGEQDLLLFALISIISSLCLKIKNNKDKKNYFFDFLFLLLICNTLIWTKAEGFVYAMIIVLSTIFFINAQKKKKFILLFFTLFLILLRIFSYKYYNLNIAVNTCCWNDLTLGGIISKINVERILIIFQYFMYGVLKNFFIIFSIIFFIFFENKIKFILKNLYLFFIILLSFCFIFTAYLLTDLDLIFMLKTGIDRLLFSISPFFIVILIEYFNSKKLKFF